MGTLDTAGATTGGREWHAAADDASRMIHADHDLNLDISAL
jgi:hypothetical protein